jgi:hypothetical protein
MLIPGTVQQNIFQPKSNSSTNAKLQVATLRAWVLLKGTILARKILRAQTGFVEP